MGEGSRTSRWSVGVICKSICLIWGERGERYCDHGNLSVLSSHLRLTDSSQTQKNAFETLAGEIFENLEVIEFSLI